MNSTKQAAIVAEMKRVFEPVLNDLNVMPDFDEYIVNGTNKLNNLFYDISFVPDGGEISACIVEAEEPGDIPTYDFGKTFKTIEEAVKWSSEIVSNCGSEGIPDLEMFLNVYDS
jgi:hypothetical protein